MMHLAKLSNHLTVLTMTQQSARNATPTLLFPLQMYKSANQITQPTWLLCTRAAFTEVCVSLSIITRLHNDYGTVKPYLQSKKSLLWLLELMLQN